MIEAAITIASPALARRRPTATSPLSQLVRFSGLILLAWSLARCLLAWMYIDRLRAVDGITEVLWMGVRVDLITLGWALAVPILLYPIAVAGRGMRLWTLATRAWLTLYLTLALLLEAASPAFLDEYQVRPSRLALEFLGRPQEVIPMLWGGFRMSVVAGVVALAGGFWMGWRLLSTNGEVRALGWKHVLLWPVLIALCVLMIRSSLQHRPANPSMFARWDDSTVNQIALNGTYTLGYALYALKHEVDVDAIYGRMPEAELLGLVRGNPAFADAPAQQPTLRTLTPIAARAKPLNLIIVVQESMGAGFSQQLSGGENDTPNLDRWSHRGWWFNNLYATGTRSARGLEAIVAGFPPSPAQSVLKRDRSQQNFATIASVLREKGYHSEFIYGGESHFDNMRGFFLGNGFNSVIDQGDYKNPVFKGSWGVSDEDLFTMAQSRATEFHAKGQSFFSLVFTSSNHTPFEYPEGRIIPDGNPHTARNAVRYADYATGKFLDEAAQSPYFKDTLILVVADHDVRIYGEDIVPVSRFRIPGLLVGADVVPKTIDSLASQIDLAPTLLSLMGISAQAPFPGRDLNRSLPEFGGSDQPRAFMQFNDIFARYEGDVLSVLVPGGEARRYRVDPKTRNLTQLAPPDATSARQLLADVQLPAWLYANDAYGLARK